MPLPADLPGRIAGQRQHLGDIDALPDLTGEDGPCFAVGGVLRGFRVRHAEDANPLVVDQFKGS